MGFPIISNFQFMISNFNAKILTNNYIKKQLINLIHIDS